MTNNERKYTENFLVLAGYKIINLSDEKLNFVFELLSRKEEYFSIKKHNGHNWDLNFASIDRQEYRLIPIIEKKMLEWEKKGYIEKIPELIPIWPEGKSFAMVLTHDVDYLVPNSLKANFRRLVRPERTPLTKKLIYFLSFILGLYKKMRPTKWFTLKDWMDVEDKYKFKSSFLFLAQPLPKPHYEDTYYSYNDKTLFGKEKIKIKTIIKKIYDYGWDIGLHGSVNSHNLIKVCKKEKEILEKSLGSKIVSIRQHHLFYDIRYTPQIQNSVGFEIDSTLGSNVSLDYRSGTGLPFCMYDKQNDKPLNIIQIPLIIQDVAILEAMQMDYETALRNTKEILRRSASMGSAVTLLWHNSFTGDSDYVKIYDAILEEAYKLNAWGCSMKELNAWWRDRFSKAEKYMKQ